MARSMGCGVYNLDYITSKWKVEFFLYFNPPFAFRVVMVVGVIIEALNGSVVRSGCNDLQWIIPTETIHSEKKY